MQKHTFASDIPYKLILRSFLSPRRLKWDPRLVHFKNFENFYREKIFLTHKKFKSLGLLEKNRDYVEKNLVFEDDNRFFVYSSCVDDKFREEEYNFLRIHNLLGFHCFEVLPD